MNWQTTSGTSARAALAFGAFSVLGTTGCGTPPPASVMPDARSALQRMHGTQDCGLGIKAAAKADSFTKQGRVRGDTDFFAIWPAKLQMIVIGPVNSGVVATLAADEKQFTLFDQREKHFLYGPPSACNIARFTTIPMPGHVLVSILRGEPPILKHEDAAATVEWSRHGYYVVKIPSTHDAEEEIHLEPHPSDFGLPWQQQRLRLVDIEVRQQGIVLYHAQLGDHAPAPMAKPQVDADGIDPPVLPSGPMCQAELPRSIHLEVPGKQADVLFRYTDVIWNPPITDSLWTQPVPPGMRAEHVTCGP